MTLPHPFSKSARHSKPRKHSLLKGGPAKTGAEKIAVLVITFIVSILIITMVDVWAHSWREHYFLVGDWQALLFVSLLGTILVHLIADLLKWEIKIFQK